MAAADRHLGLTDEVGEVAKRLEIAHSRQQHPHLGVRHDGAGDVASAVHVLDLREVVIGEQELDTVRAVEALA